MALNPVNHSRIKYIRNYYYFIKQLVSEIYKLEIIYINILVIIINYITKPVGLEKFAYIPTILGLTIEGII